MAEFCTNSHGQTKVGYKNRRLAKAAAAQSTKRTGRKIGIYQCRDCSDFHLTSNEHSVFKPEPIPSAAKLRRKLAEYSAQIACAQRRFEAAEKKLAEQRAEAIAAKQRAEAAHREEMEWVRKATDKLFGGK